MLRSRSYSWNSIRSVLIKRACVTLVPDRWQRGRDLIRLTAMSPLQYQKQIRLQTARQRMLMDGLDATSAAYEVGYESVSQFSREYSRFFGQPPIRDIKALRESNVPEGSVA